MKKFERKAHVLVIAEGVLPPAVNVAGTKVIYEMCRNLAQHGVKLDLLTSTYPNVDSSWRAWVEDEASDNLQFHVVKVPSWAKSDLLGFMFSKPQLFLRGFYLSLKSNFDIVHEYSSSPLLASLTGLYRFFSKAKTIHTLCTNNKGILGSMKWSLTWCLVNRIIVASKEMQRRIGAKQQSKTTYLPFGVDLRSFVQVDNVENSKSMGPKNDDRVVVLFLGPLTLLKGVWVFAQAAEKISQERSDAVFVFATYDQSPFDAHHAQTLSILRARFSGNPNVIFLTGHHDIPALLRSSDVFVWPQLNPFGTIAQPVTILEAMAAGKAVVASALPNITDDLIEYDKNGLLFAPGDPKSLIDRISELLNDHLLRRRLAERAQQDAMRFNMDDRVEDLITLYEEILRIRV